MPRMRPTIRSGWKGSKASGFSPVTDGQRRAAPRVAVHLRENDAGKAEAFVEVLSRIDGVLAGHGVGDEQDLLRVEQPFELLHLGHQLFINMQSARRVDDKRVAGHDARFAASLGGKPLDELRIGRLPVDFALVETGFDGLGCRS